jgi:hypothetical protein
VLSKERKLNGAAFCAPNKKMSHSILTKLKF